MARPFIPLPIERKTLLQRMFRIENRNNAIIELNNRMAKAESVLHIPVGIAEELRKNIVLTSGNVPWQSLPQCMSDSFAIACQESVDI